MHKKTKISHYQSGNSNHPKSTGSLSILKGGGKASIVFCFQIYSVFDDYHVCTDVANMVAVGPTVPTSLSNRSFVCLWHK